MTIFSRIVACGALALAALFAPAIAQDYPTRPVTIVVGYTPGATSDLVARTVGERLIPDLRYPAQSLPTAPLDRHLGPPPHLRRLSSPPRHRTTHSRH